MLTLTLETKRTLMAMAAGAVLLALGWALWPKAVGVESVVVEPGPMRVVVEEEGKTRIKDVYTVSAPVTGKVVRMMLEAGDVVRKDVNTVAIFEPTAPPFLDARAMRELEAQIAAQQAALALAEAEVRSAAAELLFAESELRRAQTLAGSNTVPERTLERARIDVDTRKAARARAEANVEVRRRELESSQARTMPPDEAVKGEVAPGCCFNVKSPVSGRVLRILQESERVVAAGTPLLEIGDPGNIEIVVDLLSADAV
jgi:HlyD family secretion protein